jgi:DNA-binding IclR family transcriptional regulator
LPRVSGYENMAQLAVRKSVLMKRKNVKVSSTSKINDTESKSATDRARRQFITSLGRGLDVLRAFRVNDPPLSNRELARRTGLPRPTISRITYTLTETGYLTFLEQFGCYELGGSTLVLGHVARANFDALAKARPAMERLAKITGCNVGLGARDQLNMVYLVACQGPALIGLRLDVGARVPIVSSAMGRAFIAACTDDERKKLVKKLKTVNPGNDKKVDWVAEHASHELASRGFCVSVGEWHPDIHGVAVPITSRELGGLYVLNCGGPAYLLPHEKLMSEVGPALLKAVEEIKVAVGAMTKLVDAVTPQSSESDSEERSPKVRKTTLIKGLKAAAGRPRAVAQPIAMAKQSLRRTRARA